MKLVLASRSPRRAELLRAAGIEFTIRSMEVDETPREGELPRDYVLRLAREKALAVTADETEVVLAADTTVVLGAEIMGKPVDAADATRMIRCACRSEASGDHGSVSEARGLMARQTSLQPMCGWRQ